MTPRQRSDLLLKMSEAAMPFIAGGSAIDLAEDVLFELLIAESISWSNPSGRVLAIIEHRMRNEELALVAEPCASELCAGAMLEVWEAGP